MGYRLKKLVACQSQFGLVKDHISWLFPLLTCRAGEDPVLLSASNEGESVVVTMKVELEIYGKYLMSTVLILRKASAVSHLIELL